jgi:MarR family transcriptional regulator for hemolysin
VRHLDRLEAEGLLTRRRDDVDRRITRIDITPAGRQRHHELAEVSIRTNTELRQLISDHDEQTVRAVLQRFTDHVTTRHDSNHPNDPPTSESDAV